MTCPLLGVEMARVGGGAATLLAGREGASKEPPPPPLPKETLLPSMWLPWQAAMERWLLLLHLQMAPRLPPLLAMT